MDNGLNRVLRKDVFSKVNIPPFDRSAMDGFAIKAEKSFKAKDQKVEIKKRKDVLEPGKDLNIKLGFDEAVKINTGAPIPSNADAVIREEAVKELEDRIIVREPVAPGGNVSKKGEDLNEDEKVFESPKVLKPQDLAILRSIGKDKIKVTKKPRIGIITTGNELIKKWDDNKIRNGKIVDSNSVLLSKLIQESNGIPNNYGIIPDEPDEIEEKIKEASKQNDLVLVSGGSAKSSTDIPPKILELELHGVSIRPGKAFGFAMMYNKPIFLVSGYPVAAMVQYVSLIRPSINKLRSKPRNNESFSQSKKFNLSKSINSVLGRRHYIRVSLDNHGNAKPVKKTGSGVLTSITKSDGYVVVPEGSEGYKEGEMVNVISWRD